MCLVCVRQREACRTPVPAGGLPRAPHPGHIHPAHRPYLKVLREALLVVEVESRDVLHEVLYWNGVHVVCVGRQEFVS